MTALEAVSKLVARLSPTAICDDCVVTTLDASSRQHINRQIRELAGNQGYRRTKDVCGMCDRQKLVLRHN
jgi:hypothetical protein